MQKASNRNTILNIFYKNNELLVILQTEKGFFN